LLGAVAFGGNCDNLDVDRAVDELRKAGYEVHYMPDHYRSRMVHPLDEIVEVVISGEAATIVNEQFIAALWREVDAIVAPSGGLCDEFGAVEDDYVPFADVSHGRKLEQWEAARPKR
jgi:hypothetical protein